METILPASDCLDLIKLMATAQHITAIIQSRQEVSRCPLCHHPSSRIHSRYIRHLLDLPWHGVAMRLELHVRRFFCDEPACRRHIFTERFSQVVAPYARRTSRLDDWFKLVGLALGGEAGARLLRGMGVATSPDALLMYIRSLPYTVPTSPRVVGIDEFAFRRGRVFGTILVDLERRRVLDLLPDCDQETVKRWLQQHSSIEIVSRDRAANFGEAIRQGARRPSKSRTAGMSWTTWATGSKPSGGNTKIACKRLGNSSLLPIHRCTTVLTAWNGGASTLIRTVSTSIIACRSCISAAATSKPLRCS